MSHTRTVLVTPDFTLLSGSQVRRTPPDAFAGGPAALVARIAPMFSREGVVLVDYDAARKLGLAESWQTFDGDPRVYLGVVNEHTDPLVRSGWSQDTVASHDMFHELVGVAFHRSPGVTGLSLLQKLYPKGKSKPIAWQTDGPTDAYELQYYPLDFRRDDPARFRHGYDRRRSGLAAMGVVQVARYALRHRKVRTFDARLAGWWKVEIPPWNEPRMPNPAGYCAHGPHPHACLRWLTTPTIELLEELAQQGLSEGVRHIHDAWVADRSRLFFDWSNALETAHNHAEGWMNGRDGNGYPLPEALDAERVRDAIKAVYRETPGMFAGTGSWVARPDWFAAKVAVERCNAWRAVWRAMNLPALRESSWPTRVDGDKWWFPSDREDAVGASPVRIGPQLGEWRHEGTVIR